MTRVVPQGGAESQLEPTAPVTRGEPAGPYHGTTSRVFRVRQMSAVLYASVVSTPWHKTPAKRPGRVSLHLVASNLAAVFACASMPCGLGTATCLPPVVEPRRTHNRRKNTRDGVTPNRALESKLQVTRFGRSVHYPSTHWSAHTRAVPAGFRRRSRCTQAGAHMRGALMPGTYTIGATPEVRYVWRAYSRKAHAIQAAHVYTCTIWRTSGSCMCTVY